MDLLHLLVLRLTRLGSLMSAFRSAAGRSRREFIATSSATAIATTGVGIQPACCMDSVTEEGETDAGLVTKLFESLTEQQRREICFDWNHKTKNHGVLRTHVSANWQITPHPLTSNFYSSEQKEIVEAIFWSLYNPEWKNKVRKQLKDDSGGYGLGQSLALFGNPEDGPFEAVISGRHLTVRCDGNTTAHAAFGGPIFYGHAAEGFNEEPDHPGNVYWSQAIKANEVYSMLNGAQRQMALVKTAPAEHRVDFRVAGKFPGIPVSELTIDQRQHLEGVLKLLVEPYRQRDRSEALQCLKTQGGLDQCALSFYESDDVGQDGIWDTWRLEGPSFVWHYRGDPHVHVWVNIADDASLKISTEA